jgi:hypothetical protein
MAALAVGLAAKAEAKQLIVVRDSEGRVSGFKQKDGD